MKRQIVVNVDELKIGMILEKDIISSNGICLLSEGFEFDDIEKIKNMLFIHDVHKVNVLVEEGMDDTYTKEYFEVYDFKQDMRELLYNLKMGFSSIEYGEGIKKDDFEKTIENAIKACDRKLNLFKLINKLKDMDDYIYMHSMTVTLTSYQIGKWIGLSEYELKELTLAAILSDLGKIKISKDIIGKSEKLTKEEYEEIKKHCTLGYKMVKEIPDISDKIKKAVFEHHEKIDGSGYPIGKKGEQICTYAKIIAIADVYSALTSNRPYRDKHTPFDAIKILEEKFLSKLDTEILYLFLKKIAGEYLGNKVVLDNGKIGKIIFIPNQNICRPLVEIEDTDEIIDLSNSKNSKVYIKEFI
ncbi:MAG: HD-GYP domain-containing protein [Tepidibacter sp.]|jgi:HD-GYP domain-containing protein (c-di-GMP phosphodiesterase class II)|uniref:HD-GYP domain-containing protein n=1 Tax=Tepidibacter sp. TaxID=2529387 RepID=UPI0025E40E3D|nr:HD-GYP domain-containing protein [Tepidibacter sp.]MCT4507507.1 HD-GYP domain-containing protein [Tepidibacter sp.]